MKKMLFLFTVLFAKISFAQFAPLPTTPTTVALWNFNESEGEVLDSTDNPLNGQVFSVEHSPIPGIETDLGNAYRFPLPSSFIDLGVMKNTKIDFTGATAFKIEALIHLSANAPGTHVIADFENVRFEVINNQLAGLVRQPGGLVGVISTTQLQQDTTYRVGMHFTTGLIILSINGIVDSKVVIDHPIATPFFANSRAYLGGNIYGQNFPGFIDDIRVSSVTGIDYTDPVITLVQPTYQVKVPKPNFLFNLSDEGSGVDPSSIKVYLNGSRQNNLNITVAQISGEMDDNLSTMILNEVKILLSDFSGNSIEKKFYFIYLSVLGKGEYVPDGSTLALWHMNDFSQTETVDSSGNNHHGYSVPRTISSGDGVFSKGRNFTSSKGSLITFDGVRFGNSFTIEGWYRPSTVQSDELLFYNGQISVYRIAFGQVRILFHTFGGTLQYTTPSNVLPAGELHHLAVSWDSHSPGSSLVFYTDGFPVYSTEAVRNCDFDETPRAGSMGSNYNGMMDEVRVSSIARSSFNIPIVDNQVITFLTLKDGTGVTTEFPELHAVMNTNTTIDLDTLRISLNGVNQPIGTGLIVTETSIDGTMSDPVKEGLNIIEIEFTDNEGNYRKKSQFFIKSTLLGLFEYEADPTTAALWHFNTDTNLQDSSSSAAHLGGGRAVVPGALESAQSSNVVSLAAIIPMNCRSFTIEGYFKVKIFADSETGLLRFAGPNIDTSIFTTNSNGSMRLTSSYNGGYTFDQRVSAAFTPDNAYHHFAMVYDNSRNFGQMMLFVDGQLKLVESYKSVCNATVNHSVSISGDYYSFDEIKITRKAKYAFNVMRPGTSIPSVTSASHSSGQTVNSESISFSVTAADDLGIDLSKTKVLLNGSPQTYTASSKAKFETILSSQLNLSVGSNVVKLKLFNTAGNEFIRIWTINRSAR